MLPGSSRVATDSKVPDEDSLLPLALGDPVLDEALFPPLSDPVIDEGLKLPVLPDQVPIAPLPDDMVIPEDWDEVDRWLFSMCE